MDRNSIVRLIENHVDSKNAPTNLSKDERRAYQKGWNEAIASILKSIREFELDDLD